MPIANSVAIISAVRPNSAPTNTIIADIPTNSRNVFSLLACGCQVMGVSSYDLITAEQRLGGRFRFRSVRTGSAVPADGVVDQRLQRLPAGTLGQQTQLVPRPVCVP